MSSSKNTIESWIKILDAQTRTANSSYALLSGRTRVKEADAEKRPKAADVSSIILANVSTSNSLPNPAPVSALTQNC